MKKLYFVLINIVLIFFLPSSSFSSSVDLIDIVYQDDFTVAWEGDGNNFMGINNPFTMGPASIYIEPSGIYPNNKALIKLNGSLYERYDFFSTNVKGNYDVDVKFSIADANKYENPNIKYWKYNSGFYKSVTPDITSLSSNITTKFSVPLIIDTGKLYSFFPYVDRSLWGQSNWGLGEFTLDHPLQKIDPNNDAYFQANFDGSIILLSYDVSPVPEPSTMLLLGSGLVGLVGFGRRKMKK